MLDHYYTPRDLPVSDLSLLETDDPLSNPILTDLTDTKPRGAPEGPAVVDLSAFVLAFDCDSDSESGSDDGYVSTLLRIQRAPAPAAVTPRKIAGARRVARAVSAPQQQRVIDAGMDIDLGVNVDVPMHTGPTKNARNAQEGELFQSITAIPGLESTSFEELRLETYLQSLVATGTARPHPAFAPSLVIPPAFAAQFVEPEGDGEGDADANADADIEMVDAEDVQTQRQQYAKTRDPRKTLDPRKAKAARDPPTAAEAQAQDRDSRVQTLKQAPFVFRAASYPPAGPQWG